MPPPPPPPPPPLQEDGAPPLPPPPPPPVDEENPSSCASSSDDDDEEGDEDESSSGTSGSGSGSSSDDEETHEDEDEEEPVIVVPEQDVVPTQEEEAALNDLEKAQVAEEDDEVRTGVSFSDEAEYYEYNDQGAPGPGGYGFDHGESLDGDNDNENAVTDAEQDDDLKKKPTQVQAQQKQAQQLEREKRRLKKHRPGSCSSRKVFLLIGALLLLAFIVIMITYVATKSSREPTPSPTASPTMAPTLSQRAQRLQDLETIIRVHEATPTESLLDTTSPSYKALLWLADEDPLQLPPRLSMNPIVLNDNRDILMRFAMATFYFATQDSNLSPYLILQQQQQQQQQQDSTVTIIGNKRQRRDFETYNNTTIDDSKNQTLSMWTRQDKWMTKAPTCDWYGITCNETTTEDTSPNIIQLELANNNVQGTIPLELNLLLESLRHVNLSGNALQSTLPTNLYRMTQLTTLDLHDNQLTGVLLDDFQFLDKLEYLDLSDNEFAPQSIPSTIVILPALKTFLLSHNQFSGPLDIFGVNLESLDVSHNQLSGTIPIAFQDNPRWQGLWFNNNPSLTGVIPSGLCQVPILKYDCFWNNTQGVGGGLCGCEDCSCDAILGNATNTNTNTNTTAFSNSGSNSTNTTTVTGSSVPASTPTISPPLLNPLPTIASPFKEKTGNIFNHQGDDKS